MLKQWLHIDAFIQCHIWSEWTWRIFCIGIWHATALYCMARCCTVSPESSVQMMMCSTIPSRILSPLAPEPYIQEGHIPPHFFESRMSTGAQGWSNWTNSLTAKYTVSAPESNRIASGAVLAPSFWGRGAVERGMTLQRGVGHWKNFEQDHNLWGCQTQLGYVTISQFRRITCYNSKTVQNRCIVFN